jgi:uncharacterized protein (DUF1697 family)
MMAGREEKKAVLVALLRGINVGTAKRVAMADLRALMERLGYVDVRTLLNSGNVVFSAARADPREGARRIENGLEAQLGVSARVMVISAGELEEIVAANPLSDVADNPSRHLVGIFRDAADRDTLGEIVGKDWGEERVALVGPRAGGAARALYMWMPRGVIESRLYAAVSRALKDGMTARNWATMLKLKEMTGA